MEAQKFISDQEIQDQIQKMITEQNDEATFVSGKRVKIAIVVKNSTAYAKYEKNLLQFDTTINGQIYTIVCGVN
jgi:hypothetical protein